MRRRSELMVQNVVIRGELAGVEKVVLVDANGKIATNATLQKGTLVSTTVNNATFSATVTGSDIDLSNYSNIIITYKTGADSDAATMDISFQIKDTAGNYITHTTIPQITTATTGYEEIFGLAHKTGRVVCTYGGSGNFATTTVELTAAQ
jgi:hypothetical protein